MAKTQIKNYVFKPGIGALDNRYSDAYSLLERNKTFIQKETNAYITNKIANAAQYTPSGAVYLPATGVMTLTIGTHNFNIGDAILIAEESLTFTCALDGNTSPKSYPRAAGVPNTTGTDPFYDKAILIIATTPTTITVNVGISSDTSAHTFVSAEPNAVSDVFFNYVNDSQAKCERDVGYVIDSYLYDLRYGGNYNIRKSIKYYWDQTVAQVDGNRGPELAAHNFIGRLIKDFIFTNTLYSALNVEVTQTIDNTKTVTNLEFTPSTAVYRPASGEMTLTIGTHNLAAGTEIFIAPNGITFTCALDSNATTHSYPRASGVPNQTGKDPFYYAPLTITSVTATTITVNVGISSDTSVHTFSSAVANSVTAGPSAKINTLVFNTVDVIANGLNSMPTLVPSGVGKVKIQGKHDLADFLLITNATKNEIIYNFSNPNTGGSIEFKTDGITEDEDFVKFLQTTDGVTTLTLNYDTSSHSSTDELQLFIEKTDNGTSIVTTRPYNFGSDAIERMRIAPPLSMLDADFEYGLQPTKWAAIGTLRGYPSVYEIPGTDTPVLSIVTDASAGTEGIGQSLITVTTVSPHGFTPGNPVTIKALEDAVVGAARAEGSFVIVTVPTPTTFTYYAKAKVGTVNPTVLSTTYSQLRQAGFYTGSSIGSSSIAVVSNGSAGTLVAELNVEVGETRIPYDGPSPSIGAPVTNNAGITLGTQVTSVIDQSAGGGVYVTPAVTGNITSGSTTVTVVNASGIVQGLAVDRGDGTATFITGIAGNELEFSDPFVANLSGNVVSYTNLSGINDPSIGVEATFDISIVAGEYVLDAINQTGRDYQIGDRISISGNDLGGSAPDNDALIIVQSTFSDGAIDAATISGTAFDGNATITDIAATYAGGNGTGAAFDAVWVDGAYTIVDIPSPNESIDYIVNDVIKIPGNIVDPLNGVTPANDLFVKVTGIGTGGGITSVSFSGTAPGYIKTISELPYTTSGAGSGAEFDVTLENGTYNVTKILDGIDFLPDDTITILGINLEGTTPANDLTITVTNVGELGEILTFATSGAAFNGSSNTLLVGDNFVGSDATFDVELAAGVYTVLVNNPGSNYSIDQQLTIPGNQLFGTTPANDLTITITGVDQTSTGVITTVSSAGTANAGGGSFTDVSGTSQDNAGAGALFNISRNFNEYTSITLVDSGADYAEGNRIVLRGSTLGGENLINDIIISVTNVDTGGEILSFNTDYIEAASGVNFDLYATVTLSEPIIAPISRGATADFEELATLEVTFASAHGLVPGDTFIVTTSSDNGVNNHSLSAGSFFATEMPSVNKLRYQARAAGPINTIDDNIVSVIYPRPDSFFIHRPFDGGVQLGTGGPQHGAQAIRQSKKYIRYQSGKGIMYTTGALFAPSYDLRSVTADGVEVGAEITIVTDDNDHGVQVGGIVRILGVETPGYNSGPETATPPQFDYEVIEVLDERTFKIRAQRRLGATNAVLGFGAQMSVISWHGATVRSGIFDDQNGIFWEFDGTQINVVQRTGTQQLAGTISMNVDNNVVTGANTRFRDQLKAGDRIIIKGMTHVVSHVNSQTECTVTPDWRGVVDITGAKANLIVDKRVKQEDFNLDRLDGTGPSGYDIDIAKMQMIGIQYSWYGAGFIDYMLRGSDGNFVFAHRMRNSNVNTEAFMRSGNLPVRYEVANEGPSGKLAQAMNASQTSMVLNDTSFFPTSGVVYIDNEIISFTGNNETTNTLTGLTRSATFSNFQAGATRSYTAGLAASHDARTGVVLISNTITPLISHWGSAFITDGGFDEDRGYIFSYAETGVSVSTTKQTAFLIRLSPSVSNALIGDLGERELLNRAQLLLSGLEITSNTPTTAEQGGIVIEGVLNPQNYPINPGDVGWSGLSTVAQGGQPSFAQIAAGGSVVWSSGAASTNATITAQANLNATTTIRYNAGNNRNFFYSRADTWLASGAAIGDYATASTGGATWGSGIQITNVQGPFGSGDGAYVIVNLASAYNGPLNTGNVVTIERRFTLVNRNFGLFTKASVDASGVRVGTSVTGGSVTFPANTQINNIGSETFNSTEYYRIQFNNTFTGTLAANTGTVQLTFVQPPFAQPGETVFSFVANPGERATLDLSELKELTNTPLGGRGTYPNGPDVLAINVYKVSGDPIASNIIIRWGEAQA